MSKPDASPLKESLTKPFSQFFRFQDFWRTRSAIKRSEPLYEQTPDERIKNGYLHPWAFSIQQSIFAAMPAIGATKLLDFLYGKIPAPSPVTSHGEWTTIFVPLVRETDAFYSSFFLPLAFTAFAFLVGWGSLKKSDSTPGRRKRAREAYLYLDGTYGFFSQATLALLIALGSGIGSREVLRDKLTDTIVAIWAVLFLLTFLFQVRLTNSKIPKLLFAINGYPARIGHFWRTSRPDDPPFHKFTASILIGGWPLVIAVSLLLTILSLATAALLTSVKIWCTQLIG